jgi:NAD(P)-dependent dehydrogenase (short-subunit alcohol dehydrogenase family)
VNQVTPGGTKTPIWSDRAPTGEAMAALEEALSGMTALGRMDEAEEITKAALYLASDEASFVTGAEIVADGGATRAPIGAPVYRIAAGQ